MTLSHLLPSCGSWKTGQRKACCTPLENQPLNHNLCGCGELKDSPHNDLLPYVESLYPFGPPPLLHPRALTLFLPAFCLAPRHSCINPSFPLTLWSSRPWHPSQSAPAHNKGLFSVDHHTRLLSLAHASPESGSALITRGLCLCTREWVLFRTLLSRKAEAPQRLCLPWHPEIESHDVLFAFAVMEVTRWDSYGPLGIFPAACSTVICPPR